MRLFRKKDYQLEIAPEALTIKAFKDLYKRDRSVDKSKVEKEFAFIYFVYDPRSELQILIDVDERIAQAKELLGMDEKFKQDVLIQKAISVYISMVETSSSLLLQDIKRAVNNIRDYLSSTDVDDDNFDKYVRAVEKLIPLSEKLLVAEKKVMQEVEEESNARGDKALTITDGGFENLF